MGTEKIWHVFEKPSIPRYLKKNGYVLEVGANIDFYGPVFDSESEHFMYFKHDDGKWYQYGQPSDLIGLSFMDNFGIDHERFIGMDYTNYNNFAISHHNDIANNPDFINPDSYIYYVDAFDFTGPIAAMNHAIYVHAELSKCHIKKIGIGFVITDNHTIPLNDAINEVVKILSLPLENPINQITKLKNQACLSIKGFAEYFGIEYRTVQNWVGNVNKYPKWAPPLFQLKLLTDGKI